MKPMSDGKERGKSRRNEIGWLRDNVFIHGSANIVAASLPADARLRIFGFCAVEKCIMNFANISLVYLSVAVIIVCISDMKCLSNRLFGAALIIVCLHL